MKYDLTQLEDILALSMTGHSHLCPRQVLGARIGLAGAAALGLEIPRRDKQLLVIVETDGCFVDGVAAATGCAVGHRTMRVEDYGKVAATFVHVRTNLAVRVAPRLDVRQRAWDYAPDEKQRYQAMLKGYQMMPDDELLSIENVLLSVPVESIISRAGVRENCQECGEEIINEREILEAGRLLCRACARPAYYEPAAAFELSTGLRLPEAVVIGANDE